LPGVRFKPWPDLITVPFPALLAAAFKITPPGTAQDKPRDPRSDPAEIILGGAQFLRENSHELPAPRRRDLAPSIKSLRGPANDCARLLRARDPDMDYEFSCDRRCGRNSLARERALRDSKPGQDGKRFVTNDGRWTKEAFIIALSLRNADAERPSPTWRRPGRSGSPRKPSMICPPDGRTRSEAADPPRADRAWCKSQRPS
jgi:hypothetical protein